MLKKLAAFPFLFSAIAASAQADSGATAVYQPAIDSAIAVYHRFRGEESNLYQGLAVEQAKYTGKNTPFFAAGDWSTGSVLYDGVKYDNVSLKYNLVRDELIVLNATTRNAFYLFRPRVDFFTLGDKLFLNLKKNGRQGLPPEGYYQQLVRGPITVLAKHGKSLQENITSGNVEQRFDAKILFYALKDGKFYPLSNAKSLYELTGSLKNAIKAQLKKQGGESKKDLAETLTDIAHFYNQFNH